MKKFLLVLLCLGSIFLQGCGPFSTYAEGRSIALAKQGKDLPGLYYFLFEDFYSLNTYTMQRTSTPWKLMTSAMMVWRKSEGDTYEFSQEGLHQLLSYRYGFARPKNIANWPYPERPQPSFDKPAGIVTGMVDHKIYPVYVEVANQTCITCHSGILYNSNGTPQPDQMWAGLPSTSVNLERYAAEIYSSFLYLRQHEDEVFATMKTLYPELTSAEEKTLRKTLLPKLNDRIAELEKGMKRLTPFDLGSAGLTNGPGAMKVSNKFVSPDTYLPEEVGFTSIPDLYALRLRASTMYDGVYFAPGTKDRFAPLPSDHTMQQQHEDMAGMITLVTIGTLGIDPKIAPKNIPAMRKIMDFIIYQYEPATFPGEIDTEKATRGRVLFENKCSECHGTYSEGVEKGKVRLVSYPNRNVSQDFMGTDPSRWKTTYGGFANALAKTPMGKYVVGEETKGYVALPLTSLWATAPYLHNGSVPTLWHMMHPEERPAAFPVGGHKLDFEKVGIALEKDESGVWAFPRDYKPWTLPDVYDTTKPGRSNKGHNVPFSSMTEEEKSDLLEFLKLL